MSPVVTAAAAADGRLTAARGVVIDVDFPAGHLPAIEHALVVERTPLPPLILEVQSHIAPGTARCLCLGVPTGMRRGLHGRDTGGPLMTRVGDDLLGRVLNVFGEPVDGGPPLNPDGERRSIHVGALPLQQQEPITTP